MEDKNKNFGYNALAKEYGDMIKFGVIVPTKVERVALKMELQLLLCFLQLMR